MKLWLRIIRYSLSMPSVFLTVLLTSVVSLPVCAQDVDLSSKMADDFTGSPPSRSDVANVTDVTAPSPLEMPLDVQLDPLNSPHPVPWGWVLETHQDVSSRHQSGVRYYRSPALISPDGAYAAYSRIQLHVEPELYLSRVSSIMFLENLQTGNLQMVAAASQFAENLLLNSDRVFKSGAIAMLMPVSWTEDSTQILARQFEGIFSSSDLSDYAVVWDRTQDSTHVLAPTHSPYDIAVLMGWSRAKPDQILFQAGSFGDDALSLWSVDLQGQTQFAVADQPLVIGERVMSWWSGPQAYYLP